MNSKCLAKKANYPYLSQLFKKELSWNKVELVSNNPCWYNKNYAQRKCAKFSPTQKHIIFWFQKLDLSRYHLLWHRSPLHPAAQVHVLGAEQVPPFKHEFVHRGTKKLQKYKFAENCILTKYNRNNMYKVQPILGAYLEDYILRFIKKEVAQKISWNPV